MATRRASNCASRLYIHITSVYSSQKGGRCSWHWGDSLEYTASSQAEELGFSRTGGDKRECLEELGRGFISSRYCYHFIGLTSMPQGLQNYINKYM